MKLTMRAFVAGAVFLACGASGTSNAQAGGLLAKLFKGKCGASEPACCEPEPEPTCCEPEPEPEPVCCEPAPEPEPVCCEPEPAPEPVCCEPEPEPVCCEPEPEPAPEPVCCEPEPEPVCCEPDPEPCCASFYPLPELAEGEVLLSISPITFPAVAVRTGPNATAIVMNQ